MAGAKPAAPAYGEEMILGVPEEGKQIRPECRWLISRESKKLFNP